MNLSQIIPLTLNQTNYSQFQGKMAQGVLVVELNSGTTVSLTKNYQYNLYYQNPFESSSSLLVIPILQVNESYIIPESRVSIYFPLFNSQSMMSCFMNIRALYQQLDLSLLLEFYLQWLCVLLLCCFVWAGIIF